MHSSTGRTIHDYRNYINRPRPTGRLPKFERARRQHAFSTQSQHTIYALSTAPGRAAIAVIRISGPACLDVYSSLCPGKNAPKPRTATVRTLFEPHTALGREDVLDSSALILYFPAPRTVTGEDVLELHVHGGPAVVKAVLSAIPKCKSSQGVHRIRYAEPGEFTRRAFMTDRLDLTQVEALGDTLAATTEQQRRLSVRGTTSSLAKRYESWRQQLLYARGELEALIDFSEDQHFDESPSDLCASVASQVQSLKQTLQVHSQNAVRGEMLRNGISISLLGAPNAGKSSLLNRIVGREAAIVSQEAGTTRDVVEVGLDLGGYFCRLGDTAGLRQAKQDALQSSYSQEVVGQIEKEGMRRAKERAAESDVVIAVLSFERNAGGDVELHLDPEVISTAAELVSQKDSIVVVINKCDLAHDNEIAIQQALAILPGLTADRIHLISCKAATEPQPTIAQSRIQQEPPGRIAALADLVQPDLDPGRLQAFLQGLVRHFGALTAAVSPELEGAADADPSVWQESLGATERHRLLLEGCIGHLDAFLEEVERGTSVDLSADDDGDGEQSADDVDIVVAAEHLRFAAECLAKITGKGEAGDVEEVLGVVFEKFCVGK